MDISALLEQIPSSNGESKLGSILSKKVSNNNFTNVFDTTIGKIADKPKKVDVVNTNTLKKKDTPNTQDLKNISNVSTKNIKSSDKVSNISKIDDDTKMEFEDDKDEIKDNNELINEVFKAVLEILNDNNINLEDYIEINDEGNFELKVDASVKLISSLTDILGQDKIDEVNMILDDSFNLENLVAVSTNFMLSDANNNLKILNAMQSESNVHIEDITDVNKDLVSADDTFNVTLLDSNKVVINESIADDSNEDKFKVLKDTINEMIDEVNIKQAKADETNEINVKVLNEKDPNIKPLLNKEVSKDGNEIINNEEVTSDITAEVSTSLEKVMTANETENSETSKDNKESKDEGKDVTRHIKINNNESVFEPNLDPNFTFNLENNINSNIEIKEVHETITDRFIETVNVAKQMVKGASLLVTEHSEEMSIKLDPENLGKVNLKIITENGLVMAKFEVESQRVKEIIESNLSLLKESLTEKGVSINGLEVSVGQNSTGQNNRRDNIDDLRKIVSGKNPHKILGKTINKFSNPVEIDNRHNKVMGLYMTRSQINYIA